jgi:hypothetical protein
MMIVSGYTNPQSSRVSNSLDLVNEAFILILTYHLYQFTEFMPDLSMRSNVGLSMILITVLGLLISIGNVVVETASLSMRKLKLRYLAWKQAREIKRILKRKLYKLEMSALRKKIRAKDEQVQRRILRAQEEREKLAAF